MKTVFIPKQNEKDLVEIPANVKDDLQIIPVDHVSEVIEKSLIKKGKSASKQDTGPRAPRRNRRVDRQPGAPAPSPAATS